MKTRHFSLDLASAQDTADFARALAPILVAGDVVLLDGAVGAGKTHLARCLIQSIQTPPEDVPSPTFTLVQTYDTRQGWVWHADLYRLSNVHEIEELGLADAFSDAICLIEWPDRLGELTPVDALFIDLKQCVDENSRQLHARWSAAKWDERLTRWTR